jgi:hypothetical protein
MVVDCQWAGGRLLSGCASDEAPECPNGRHTTLARRAFGVARLCHHRADSFRRSASCGGSEDEARAAATLDCWLLQSQRHSFSKC